MAGAPMNQLPDGGRSASELVESVAPLKSEAKKRNCEYFLKTWMIA
jgi:hypothetical protein